MNAVPTLALPTTLTSETDTTIVKEPEPGFPELFDEYVASATTQEAEKNSVADEATEAGAATSLDGPAVNGELNPAMAPVAIAPALPSWIPETGPVGPDNSGAASSEVDAVLGSGSATDTYATSEAPAAWTPPETTPLDSTGSEMNGPIPSTSAESEPSSDRGRFSAASTDSAATGRTPPSALTSASTSASRPSSTTSETGSITMIGPDRRAAERPTDTSSPAGFAPSTSASALTSQRVPSTDIAPMTAPSPGIRVHELADLVGGTLLRATPARVRVQLHPEHLGAVTIDVRRVADQLQVTVTATTNEAIAQLRTHHQELLHRLDETTRSAVSLHFNLASASGEGTAERQWPHERSETAGQRGEPRSTADQPPAPRRSMLLIGSTGRLLLDL